MPAHPDTLQSGASRLSGTLGRSWHHVRMDLQNLAGDVWQRIVPGPAPEPGRWILVAVLVALLVVVLPPLWRYARLVVTIVHELGRAAVGIAVGRRSPASWSAPTCPATRSRSARDAASAGSCPRGRGIPRPPCSARRRSRSL